MVGGPGGMSRLMNQETSKPKSTTTTLLRFGKYFRPYWPVLLLVALLVVVSTWAQVTVPELIGQVVDCYLTPTVEATFIPSAATPTSANQPSVAGTTTTRATNCWLTSDQQPSGFTQRVITRLYTTGGFTQPPAVLASMTSSEKLAGLGRMVLIIILLFVISSAFTGLTFFSMSWAGQHVLRTLRVEVFQRLHQLSLDFYGEHEAGDLMSRITNDAETIQQALSFALVNVLTGMLLLVWIAYSMLMLSPVFALLSLIVVPAMAVATLWFSAQARKAFRRTRVEMGNVNAELQESIAAVREVQAFNRENENIENFRIANAANRDANVRAVAFTTALAPTLEGFGYLAMAIVTCVGGLALLGQGTILGTAVSLGLVITFLGYVQRFNQPIQQIAVLWTNLQSAIAGGERMFNLLDETPSIVEKPEARVMPEIQGSVVFDNVCASYKPGQPVLENVSFKAEPGQTIAIVGPTGAGKTTIINLIPRFYDVCSGDGTILIDGIDVRDVTLESLRKQIGIVLQDTFLFSTTVMENIRFGKPDASDEEVLAAAKIAHVDTFVERLPDGYQTILGERGSGLSQGQRQLIAIARAALANPRILILDEATSSVDTRTERLIQKALETLLKGRTSFVIAHRLSTIRNADMLLVVDHGRIIERGRHDELLAQKGFYYNLYMSQFRASQTEGVVHLKFGDASGSDGHKNPNLAPASD
jgi:ATP-binding cassette subfamily B multidrug efflux pump